MQQFAVAAMGSDRPGIVAAVGETLLDAGVNIDDSSMTILGGHFAMLLLVEGDCALEELEEKLDPVSQRFGLLLEVRPAERRSLGDIERDDYVVAAYGPDKPGLVSALSRILADVDANINDFGSRIGADNTFAMWFNVGLADGTDVERLADALRDAGSSMQLDVRLYRAEAEDL